MAKDKQYFKMDEIWRVFMIESTIGHQLMMLSRREPGTVKKITAELHKVLIKESRDPKYHENPGKYIEDMSEMIIKLWSTFIGHKMMHYLEHGCPKATNKTPRIITNPATGMGRRFS